MQTQTHANNIPRAGIPFARIRRKNNFFMMFLSNIRFPAGCPEHDSEFFFRPAEYHVKISHCRIVLNISLTAGGTRVSAYGATPPPRRMIMRHGGGADQTAAPQGPCPLPSRARRTGIESRDEERKKGFAQRSLWAAKPHEGVSELAVDTCLISAVAIRKAPSSPRAFCD